MKILIVEDDLMQRRFLQVMLTQSGREVIAAASKSALNSFVEGLKAGADDYLKTVASAVQNSDLWILKS